MGDWKSDFDERERAKESERKRKLREDSMAADARRAADSKREREENERRYELKLKEHQAKFKCSYPGCREVSSGPITEDGYTTYSGGESGTAYSGSGDYGTYHDAVTHWDRPTGISTCMVCHKYFCDDHYHKGYCQNCARSH